MKKRLMVLAAVGVLGTTSVIFANTGRMHMGGFRNMSGNYKMMSTNIDDMEKFREERLNERKSILEERVKDGSITKNEADNIYNRMKDHHENGWGPGMGRGMGRGFCHY